MKKYPDKHFDIAIVDPPFGIGADWKKRKRNNYKATSYTNNNIPCKNYFDELERVSKNYIIFGYNYFTEYLGSTNHIIVWDKIAADNIHISSHAELAYSTFKKPMLVIRTPWDGGRKGKETGIKKIHPHQKPIELYEKILIKFGKQGDLILDTHMGSGSIAIACNKSNPNLLQALGFELTAAEIDKIHYEDACGRLREYNRR